MRSSPPWWARRSFKEGVNPAFAKNAKGWATRPDLRRIPDPDLVAQVLNQFDEPLTVARRFHADQHRRRQLLIEPLGIAAGMYQLLFTRFPSLAVDPCNLLPAGMEIYSLYLACNCPISTIPW
jgi:hypothetical protein